LPEEHRVSWLVLRAILGRALSFLGKLDVWQLGCIALALFAGVQTLRLAAETRHSHKVEAQLAKSDAARHADRLAYAKAQEAAQAANATQIAKVKAEQERITGNVERSYESDLARLRADLAQRLRQQAAKGASGNSAAPDLPNAAPGPSGSGTVCIPTEDYVSGAETELRLDALIDWVKQQVSVPTN
jgi:hypothetical protein